MASLLYSPLASTVFFFIFFSSSLSLPIPISSHTNLLLRRNLHSFKNEEDIDSAISKSKPSPKNKIKSLNKFLSADNTTPAESKLSKVLTGSSAISKTKLNKTAITGDLNAYSMSKVKLNKTSTAATTNTTKLPKLIKPLKSNFTKVTLLKSNFTKTHQLKSPKPSANIQKNFDANDSLPSKLQPNPKLKPRASITNWLDDTDITSTGGNDDDDLISDFRELPSRLHSAIVPDLEKLSTTSKLYLSKAHRDITAGVKPFVGSKYAASIASAASTALVVLPLLLVTAFFRHLLRTGTSASLHRALLFVQAYLAIYFATLSFTAVVTRLEPLRFFYATSPGAYAWTQAAQTLGYVVYLIAQLIALVVAFSPGEGKRKAGKVVVLAQMLLGLAVGMHYYITVFHRSVTGDAPRANWIVHGIYAACFIVICGLGRAESHKKAYLQGNGGDDWKKS